MTTPAPSAPTPGMVMAANAEARELFRDALSQRMWLVALYFLIFRKKVVAAKLASLDPALKPREKSPFVYDMR